MKDKNKTNEHLIEELKKLRRQISELRRKEIKFREAEEREKRYVRDLKSLSKIAVELVDLPFEEDIYQFIAEKLKELVGNCIVIMNSFDEESNTFCVRSVLGIAKHMDKVLKILGRHPVGMSAPINNEAREGLTSGKLEKVPGGIYELSIGSISKPACKAIEKLLGLGDACAMGFSWRGKLFGSAVVFMHKEAEIKDPGIIETFIRQASVALQRRRAEEALKKVNDELEIRVKERTAEHAKANQELKEEITDRKQAEKKLKQSEERYRSTLDNMMEGCQIIGYDWRYLYVNDAVARHGRRSKEELLGKTMMDTYPGIEKTEMFSTLQKCMKERIPAYMENEFKFPNGEKGWFELCIQSMPEGIFILSIDITERKRGEEKIKNSLKEKEVLLKEIHHRVKNNMQVISSLLNIQSTWIEEEKALEVLKDTRKRVYSMALIHDRLYKSEDLARVDFSQYIEQISNHLLSFHREKMKMVKVKKDVKDVFIDINKAVPLGLIINELISNSLKHAFPDEKEGELRIKFHKKNSGYELIISDNGVGFSEDLDFLKTQSMGMQLVTSLVDQIEGEIKLDRKPHTSFKITFQE